MKTTEQIKQEVINYLEKTSGHTFQKPKATFKYGNVTTPGHYEYDYENSTYFKVFKDKKGDFYILEGDKFGYKLRKIDIDYYINYYQGNAKCVIKHSLFLNNGMKSVKNTKYIKGLIKDILETLSPVKC